VTSTKLPQVDRILREQPLVALEQEFRRELLAQLVRDELADLRKSGASDNNDAGSIAQRVAQHARELLRPSLRKVINGTGIVLNTNLGRAPLNKEALSDLVELGSGYCNLEIDLVSGKRGQRSQRLDRLLRLLTGCEAALAVNNNAAAVVLAVNALALGKQVIVSRGELIEIGGSFRLPDVIAAAGGILHEVGTTNRTRLSDYRQPLENEPQDCGLLLRCHRSNFEIRGFTEGVGLQELAQLSAAQQVPLLEDLGSGILSRSTADALAGEPTVQEVVASGCDLVSFSGDKLLGGPQCGFIVGKKAYVERLHQHPLYRALRLDKLTIALAERTLSAYLSPHPEAILPTLSMLHGNREALQRRAEKIAGTVSDATSAIVCRPIATRSAPGGGSLPGEEMDSYGIELSAPKLSSNKLAQLLRQADPPVIAITQNDKVVLDFRTISESDEQLLTAAVIALGKVIS
jgi:L-seryl-tRNA(Ser) seleniumtransferase